MSCTPLPWPEVAAAEGSSVVVAVERTSISASMRAEVDMFSRHVVVCFAAARLAQQAKAPLAKPQVLVFKFTSSL